MGFHEVQFPTSISRGARLSSEYYSQVHRLSSGAVSSVLRWPGALWAFDVGFGVRQNRVFADLRTIYQFWLRRSGHAFGFRFENPFEFTTASDGISDPANDDEVGLTGDGVTSGFQMVKTYTDATGTTTKNIFKPQDGTELIAKDGNPLATPADYSLDPTTGFVQLTSIPTGGGTPEVVTFGTKFDLPCKFSPAMRNLQLLIETKTGSGVGKAPSILILEQTSDAMVNELPYTGEGSAPTFSGDLLHNYSMGHTIYLAPTTSGLSFILPTASDVPDGEIMKLINGSATDSFDCVNRTSGATEFTVPASSGAIVLMLTIGSTKTWKALKGTT